MGKKATRAVIRQRVEEVFRLRLGGAGLADIVQYASAPERAWGVSERQLFNYLAAADRLMAERFDAKAPHLLARHLLQRCELYAQARAAGDWRTALAVLQDEARLEGLYPPTKVAPTDPSGTKSYEGTLTDAERAAAVAAVLAAVGAGHAGPAVAGQAPAAGPLLGGPGLPLQ
jgi:hypothetical protein